MRLTNILLMAAIGIVARNGFGLGLYFRVQDDILRVIRDALNKQTAKTYE